MLGIFVVGLVTTSWTMRWSLSKRLRFPLAISLSLAPMIVVAATTPPAKWFNRNFKPWKWAELPPPDPARLEWFHQCETFLVAADRIAACFFEHSVQWGWNRNFGVTPNRRLHTLRFIWFTTDFGGWWSAMTLRPNKMRDPQVWQPDFLPMRVIRALSAWVAYLSVAGMDARANEPTCV